MHSSAQSHATYSHTHTRAHTHTRPGRATVARGSASLGRNPTMEGPAMRCKVVVIGDSQCGKTALLHVFAKDSYPQTYIPTVFENYTASFEIEKQRIELNMWDTSGAPYYDNVRPLAYPDSDVVLICYDVARPETLDSVLKKWRVESHEFGASTKVLLIGCKADLRADLQTLLELSKQRCIPVTQEQGAAVARQLGAAAYVECSAKLSEDSVRDVFHMATLAALGRLPRYLVRRGHSRRETASATRTPPSSPCDAVSTAATSTAAVASSAPPAEGQRAARHPRKERAKSCAVM
ncbi:rho-related GTP-binding protein RhoN-like [Lampetra planeri]